MIVSALTFDLFLTIFALPLKKNILLLKILNFMVMSIYETNLDKNVKMCHSFKFQSNSPRTLLKKFD